jgi:hypothetical protein
MSAKGIILAGVPRAGKSTLSARLSRDFNLQRLAGDPIVRALGDHFPQLDIRQQQPIPITAERITPFFLTMCQNYLDKERTGFVFDSCQIDPAQVEPILADGRIAVMFFGYPHLTAEQLFTRLRAQPREGEWTFKHPDEAVRNMCREFVEFAQNHLAICQLRNIPFFDASVDFTAAYEQALVHASRFLQP